MSKRTEWLLQAFRSIETLPGSCLDLSDWAEPAGRSDLVNRMNRLIDFFQDWSVNSGRSIYELCLTSRFSLAIILIKAFVENAAVMFCLMRRIQMAPINDGLKDFEKDVPQLLNSFWITRGGIVVSDRSVYLAALVEKYPRFQVEYDQLCRFAYPLPDLWLKNPQATNAGEEGSGFVFSTETLSDACVKNFVNGLTIFNESFSLAKIGYPAFVQACLLDL